MGVNCINTHTQFARLRNTSVDADTMVDVSQTSPLPVIPTNGRHLFWDPRFKISRSVRNDRGLNGWSPASNMRYAHLRTAFQVSRLPPYPSLFTPHRSCAFHFSRVWGGKGEGARGEGKRAEMNSHGVVPNMVFPLLGTRFIGADDHNVVGLDCPADRKVLTGFSVLGSVAMRSRQSASRGLLSSRNLIYSQNIENKELW